MRPNIIHFGSFSSLATKEHSIRNSTWKAGAPTLSYILSQILVYIIVCTVNDRLNLAEGAKIFQVHLQTILKDAQQKSKLQPHETLPSLPTFAIRCAKEKAPPKNGKKTFAVMCSCVHY